MSELNNLRNLENPISVARRIFKSLIDFPLWTMQSEAEWEHYLQPLQSPLLRPEEEMALVPKWLSASLVQKKQKNNLTPVGCLSPRRMTWALLVTRHRGWHATPRSRTSEVICKRSADYNDWSSARALNPTIHPYSPNHHLEGTNLDSLINSQPHVKRCFRPNGVGLLIKSLHDCWLQQASGEGFFCGHFVETPPTRVERTSPSSSAIAHKLLRAACLPKET